MAKYINSQNKDKVFEQLFSTAEIAQFSRAELRSYEDSVKYYRDMKNSLDTKLEGIEIGKELGREEGREQGKVEIALGMKKDGMPIETIMKYTSLTKKEIEGL